MTLIGVAVFPVDRTTTRRLTGLLSPIASDQLIDDETPHWTGRKRYPSQS